VIAFWKPASSFGGYLLIGEYGESNNQSQSVRFVGPVVVSARRLLKDMRTVLGDLHSIGGCLDLNITMARRSGDESVGGNQI
jgi:hypothetical protein